MKKNRNFLLYSIIWSIALIILIASLFQNIGYARIINYTGIVRGGSQQLVKQEIYGKPDDPLLNRLDGILKELQTGKGENNLIKVTYPPYEKQLQKMTELWTAMKEEIQKVRKGNDPALLYQQSENYFQYANTAVAQIEDLSSRKLSRAIMILIIYLILSVGSLLIWNKHRKREERKLRYQDALTKLPNQKAFEQQAANLLQQYPHQEYMLMCFDIHRFKYINDMYGYEKGDEMLRTISNFLLDHIQEGECCARISGDNFICLTHYNKDIPYTLSKALRKRIQQSMLIQDHVLFYIGLYKISNPSLSVPAMIDNAQIAHKTSKQKNGLDIIWYDEQLLESLHMESKLTLHMHDALKNHDFLLYLQPQFGLNGEMLIGSEALVRWNYDGKLLQPLSFIPLFEKNGFIIDLDFYMLENV